MTSRRGPARATLRPISVNTAIKVSADRVEGAGEADVLDREPDRLHGQRQHRRAGWHQFQRARQKAGVDGGINADRQMWAVLFDRGDRQGSRRRRPAAIGNRSR